MRLNSKKTKKGGGGLCGDRGLNLARVRALVSRELDRFRRWMALDGAFDAVQVRRSFPFPLERKRGGG